MAFNRYKAAGTFGSNNGTVDAGSSILKLTNKILADLQVDTVRSQPHSQNDSQGVVRNSRSYSDPNVVQREPHPAYYDPNTILQPAVIDYI